MFFVFFFCYTGSNFNILAEGTNPNHFCNMKAETAVALKMSQWPVMAEIIAQTLAKNDFGLIYILIRSIKVLL